ncbi:conserved membrane hypothetical protein [Tenacibaculum xiamenense]
MKYLSLLGIVSQIIVALISVAYFKRYSTLFARILCLLLIVNLIAEVIGAYCKTHQIDAFLSYYFYTGIAFTLIGVMYLKIIKSKTSKRNIKILMSLFFLLLLAVFFRQDLFTILIIFGGVNTSIFIFVYLKELLQSNEIINYKKLLSFWVSVGLLVFYLPSIPFFTMHKYMENRGLFFILNILIILMNGFISFGLIWSKEEKY